MKRRILSLVLVLCSVLACFPVLGVAAAENLPKDETPGVVSDAQTEGAHGFTDYDALYVGADGSKTANGGSLLGLYSAYGADTSVDVTGGTWKNKMDATGATNILLRDTSSDVSFVKESNGFGFHMERGQVESNLKLIGLTRPSAWAELSDFTVEQSARIDLIESETPLAFNKHSSVRLDVLQGMWIPGSRQGDKRLTGNDTYCMRWQVTGAIDGYGLGANAYAPQEYAYREAYATAGGAPGMVTAYTKSTAADGSVSFLISYNTGSSIASAKKYTAEEIAAMRNAGASNAAPVFSLFNGMSGSFYSVRVYNAPLTEAEKQHNAVIDILAYANVDVTDYVALGEANRAIVDGMLATSVFSDDSEVVAATLKTLTDLFGKSLDLDDTLYVQDGLTFFAAAFKSLKTSSYAGGASLNWVNALNPTESASLRGGFYADEKGGMTIVKSKEEWDASRDYGIYMPASALPREDYTVEITYNPVGISVRNEDGSLSRYVDEVSSSGTVHNKMGMAIGPFRAMLHSCLRPAGRDGQLEKRWYYSATADIQGMGWKFDIQDTSWAKATIDAVETYVIVHDYDKGTSSYKLYNNGVAVAEKNYTSDVYKTPEEAGNKFQLMLGVAGTAYSIRVYDRALSKDEILRNKVADIVTYYELDISKLGALLNVLGDKSSALLASLAQIPMDTTAAEAQKILDASMTAAWLSFEGVGVRKGADRDGIRYYFTCQTAAVDVLALQGYQIDVGVLLNVGKNDVPTIVKGTYDYKISTYDSAAGRNAGFFVDNNTFALTLLYEDVEKITGLTQILARGYVSIIAPDGTESIYYADVNMGEGADADSLFAVYDFMSSHDSVRAQGDTLNRIKATMERCYERVLIYVSASAAAGGDGSKSAPFRSFAAGFAKSKELLAKVNAPTHFVLTLADGEYGIYEDQVLSAEDMFYRYATLEITSTTGRATLTTTKDLTESFTKYMGNIWVCQLAKEADGSYPCFRTLYVDGKLADVAYSTDRYSVDDNPYISMYPHTYDGSWGRAYDLYKAGILTADSVSGYDRADLDADFEAYKEKFLALMDMELQFKEETLTMDSVPTLEDPTEAYLTAFNNYKVTRLVLAEMKEWYDNHRGTATQKAADYPSLEPSRYTDNKEYTDRFDALKKQIKEDASVGTWSRYYPMVETTAVAEKAKYYIHEDVVGDLRAEMEAGRKRQQAAYDALLAKYKAASDAEKAELEDDLALAAEKVADDSWYRFALEGYGPEMRLNGQWWANIIHVAGVDYNDTVIDKNGDTHVAIYLELDEYRNYQIRVGYSNEGRYVCMQDALCYVDSADEYYYDELTGKLYYYSEGGVSGKRFARGTNDYMFVFHSVRNVLITDLTFTGLDDDFLSHNDGCTSYPGSGSNSTDAPDEHAYDRSVILLDSCYGIEVYGCDFLELPARAIFGKGVLENVTIDSCNFVRLGSNAIHFGDSTSERQWRTGSNHVDNMLITNNYIHDVGRVYFPSAGIWVHYGRNLTVTHNTVDKVSWSAIALGFTYNIPNVNPSETFCNHYNVEVAYNYVTGFMQNIGDGGGIYLTGGNAPKDTTEYFNSIHHNYVLMSNSTGDGLGHMVTGIYFDGSASNWRCYENVVVEQSYGAVSGEDENFDLTDEDDVKYLTALRNRYRGSTFIYMQHILGQITHNNLLDNNYILNVRATDPEQQKKEVYKTYIVADRNIIEQNTHYVNGVDRIPSGAQDIIYEAGSYGHEGDPAILWDDNY